MIFFSVFVFDMIMIWVVLVFVVNFVLGLGLILSFVNVSWFYINLLFKIDFLLLNKKFEWLIFFINFVCSLKFFSCFL